MASAQSCLLKASLPLFLSAVASSCGLPIIIVGCSSGAGDVKVGRGAGCGRLDTAGAGSGSVLFVAGETAAKDEKQQLCGLLVVATRQLVFGDEVGPPRVIPIQLIPACVLAQRERDGAAQAEEARHRNRKAKAESLPALKRVQLHF
jgi:hypothetical protein